MRAARGSLTGSGSRRVCRLPATTSRPPGTSGAASTRSAMAGSRLLHHRRSIASAVSPGRGGSRTVAPSISVIPSPAPARRRSTTRCPAERRPSPPQTSMPTSSTAGSATIPSASQRSSHGRRTSLHSSAMPPTPNQPTSSSTSTGVCSTPCRSPSNTNPVRRRDSRTAPSASGSTRSRNDAPSKPRTAAASASTVATPGTRSGSHLQGLGRAIRASDRPPLCRLVAESWAGPRVTSVKDRGGIVARPTMLRMTIVPTTFSAVICLRCGNDVFHDR